MSGANDAAATTRPRLPTSLSRALPGSPSVSSLDFPPPLPYSPRNQESLRKLRRVTLDKDLANLKATVSVERSKELLKSPPPLPVATRGKRDGDSAQYWS